MTMFNMNIGTSFAAVQLDYPHSMHFAPSGGRSALQQNLSSSVTEGVEERATCTSTQRQEEGDDHSNDDDNDHGRRRRQRISKKQKADSPPAT